MINLATLNSGIMKQSASVSGKTVPATAQSAKKTFQHVLSDTIHSKSPSNKIPALPGIMNYAETETGDMLNEALPKSEGTNPRYDALGREIKILSTPTMYTEYVEIEINGRTVKQVTDNFLGRIGYNVEALQANNIDANMLKYVDEFGFIPGYIVPFDIGHTTDYTMTVATPDRLARTSEINAIYDSYAAYGSYDGATQITLPEVQNKTISQNAEKPPVNEAVKENRVEAEPVGKAESPVKIAGNTAAFAKFSPNLNILNMWDYEENDDKNDDEKK